LPSALLYGHAGQGQRAGEAVRTRSLRELLPVLLLLLLRFWCSGVLVLLPLLIMFWEKLLPANRYLLNREVKED